MTDEQIETFLILKYGSMDIAFANWVGNAYDFTDEQNAVMHRYSKFRFPNLNLISKAAQAIEKQKKLR